MFAAAMLEEENNRISFHWEKSFIFMQIAFIVLPLQHGCHEHTLLSNEQYFPVVLSIVLCKAAPTFDSVKGLLIFSKCFFPSGN